MAKPSKPTSWWRGCHRRGAPPACGLNAVRPAGGTSRSCRRLNGVSGTGRAPSAFTATSTLQAVQDHYGFARGNHSSSCSDGSCAAARASAQRLSWDMSAVTTSSSSSRRSRRGCARRVIRASTSSCHRVRGRGPGAGLHRRTDRHGIEHTCRSCRLDRHRPIAPERFTMRWPSHVRPPSEGDREAARRIELGGRPATGVEGSPSMPSGRSPRPKVSTPTA